MATYIYNDEREVPATKNTLPSNILILWFTREIKSIPDKKNLRQFITTKPDLQQMLKELL